MPKNPSPGNREKTCQVKRDKTGYWRGKTLSLEHREKIRISQQGPLGSSWKGGHTRCLGYILVRSPSHPCARTDGYVLEHRLVMEAYLGRPLLPTEIVHHINGIRDDNRIENLMLFSSKDEHTCFHRKKSQ